VGGGRFPAHSSSCSAGSDATDQSAAVNGPANGPGNFLPPLFNLSGLNLPSVFSLPPQQHHPHNMGHSSGQPQHPLGGGFNPMYGLFIQSPLQLKLPKEVDCCLEALVDLVEIGLEVKINSRNSNGQTIYLISRHSNRALLL
jgi:hypothetical protein